MARPDSYERKERVKLEDKVKCTKSRGWAHHWKLEDPKDGIVVARCRYCRRRKDYPATLSDYQRFETVVMRDVRPQPSYGLYMPAASYGERYG